MSAYSTLRVTRTRALKEWLRVNGGPSDEELENFMDAELESQLYNAIIVNDEDENDDDLVRL